MENDSEVEFGVFPLATFGKIGEMFLDASEILWNYPIKENISLKETNRKLYLLEKKGK